MGCLCSVNTSSSHHCCAREGTASPDRAERETCTGMESTAGLSCAIPWSLLHHTMQHRGRTGSLAVVQRCSEDVTAAWTAAPACLQGGEGAENPSPYRQCLKDTMPGLAPKPDLLIVPLQRAQEPQPSKTWSKSAAVPSFWSLW